MKSKEKMTNKEEIERLKEIICAIMLYVTEAKLDKEEIENELLNVKILEMAIEALQQERPKGEWIPKKFPYAWYYPTCSVCGFENEGELNNFCPNCGADMRGEDNDN